MDTKVLIFSMCHIFSSEFEFLLKYIKFVAVVGGGADSAVSVIQLKGNTCKTCLAYFARLVIILVRISHVVYVTEYFLNYNYITRAKYAWLISRNSLGLFSGVYLT